MSEVMPALTQDGMTKDESGRLVRVETSLMYVSKQIEGLHTDLRDNKADSKIVDARLDSLEKKAEATSTHFKWIYGVFGTFKASIVGWLVHKG